LNHHPNLYTLLLSFAIRHIYGEIRLLNYTNLKYYNGCNYYACRDIALNLYGFGPFVVASIASIGGGPSPSGGRNSNLCTKVVRYRNNSIFAIDSPGHVRLPKIKMNTFLVVLN
jgi:hypothetical protein